MYSFLLNFFIIFHSISLLKFFNNVIILDATPPPPVDKEERLSKRMSIKNTPPPLPSVEIVIEPPVKMTGMFSKRGHVVKNYKKRYFVLDGGLLSYYENDKMKSIKGGIEVAKYEVKEEIPGVTTPTEGMLYLVSGGEPDLLIDFGTTEIKIEWVHAIAAHASFYKDVKSDVKAAEESEESEKDIGVPLESVLSTKILGTEIPTDIGSAVNGVDGSISLGDVGGGTKPWSSPDPKEVLPEVPGVPSVIGEVTKDE